MLLKDGSVFTFGSNDSGQLGLGHMDDEHEQEPAPQRVFGSPHLRHHVRRLRCVPPEYLGDIIRCL